MALIYIRRPGSQSTEPVEQGNPFPVELSNSYVPPFLGLQFTASQLVKSGQGYLHTITLSATGTPTAAALTIYDNTTNSGTVLFQHTFAAAAFVPVTLLLDIPYTRGLYANVAVANVSIVLSYTPT